VSRAFKESTDGETGPPRVQVALVGLFWQRRPLLPFKARESGVARYRFEVCSLAVGRPQQNEIHIKTKTETKLTCLLEPDCMSVTTAPGRVQRLLGPPL
jgi:hypothetical protein